MTRDEIRETVLRVLGGIAPEADLNAMDPAASLRDQLDIDSVDFLNFMIGIHKELKVEIPDSDVSKFGTLDDCVNYLVSKLESSR